VKFDVTVFADDLNRSGPLACAVEEFGFDGLWVAEAAHNPFLPLTHAALATARISLGTAIAVAFPRSPMIMAQTAWDLAAEVIGAQGVLDLAETRQTYRGLGAGDANRERLYRLTLAELDQMEIALRKVDGAPVRAEEREEGYDSEAVAEYFRQLSAGG